MPAAHYDTKQLPDQASRGQVDGADSPEAGIIEVEEQLQYLQEDQVEY